MRLISLPRIEKQCAMPRDRGKFPSAASAPSFFKTPPSSLFPSSARLLPASSSAPLAVSAPKLAIVDTSESPSLFLKAVWNNLKHNWNSSKNSKYPAGDDVVILGRHYAIPDDEMALRRDFSSRLWLTYRRDLPHALPDSSLRSDCGWGCMIRSGQMLLAQAIMTHLMGRDWRRGMKPEVYRSVVALFSDHFMSAPPPFGLHRLVFLGMRRGKRAGDWFGPTCIVHVLKEALETSPVPGLRLYVAQDCTVYLDDVDHLCRPRDERDDDQEHAGDVTEATEFSQRPSLSRSSSSAGTEPRCYISSRTANDFLVVVKPKAVDAEMTVNEDDETRGKDAPFDDGEWSTSLFLCVPLRLGAECFNAVYLKTLKTFLSHESCVGVIGGKPKHSLYFIGYQGDDLISLDPHFVQPAVDTTSPNFDTDTFHCKAPRRIRFNQMDPSCCIGFYCRTRQDFLDLVRLSKRCVVADGYPLFVMKPGAASKHSYFGAPDDPPPHLIPEERVLTMPRRFINDRGEIEELEAAQEDFVFI